MLADPLLVATDVMPENYPMTIPDENGVPVTHDIIHRHGLIGSNQGWGEPAGMPGLESLRERNTAMSVVRCFREIDGTPQNGTIAGVLWSHAMANTDGRDIHEVYLPCHPSPEGAIAAAAYSAMVAPVSWTCLSVEPLTIAELIECPCGQAGHITGDAWMAVPSADVLR